MYIPNIDGPLGKWKLSNIQSTLFLHQCVVFLLSLIAKTYQNLVGYIVFLSGILLFLDWQFEQYTSCGEIYS